MCILMQNENGPCPLIALANLLSLENRIHLPVNPDPPYVSLERVITEVATLVLTTEQQRLSPSGYTAPGLGRECATATTEAPATAAFAMQVKSALDSLPALARGLDLNLQFTSCTAMEFTPELSVFDTLGVQLLHGWLVDAAAPQQRAQAAALGSMGINQVYDEIVSLESEQKHGQGKTEAEPEQELEPEVGVEPESKIEAETDTEAAAAVTAAAAAVAAAAVAAATVAVATVAAAAYQRNARARALLLMQWVADCPSQINYHGLVELHAHLRENQMAVLYRNAHFTTVCRHGGLLYLLVTDEGYLHQPSVVWECLESLDGDTSFVDGDFSLLHQLDVSASAPVFLSLSAGDDDLAFARRLQELELKGAHDAPAHTPPRRQQQLQQQQQQEQQQQQQQQQQQEHQRNMYGEYMQQQQQGQQQRAAAAAHYSKKCVVM